MSWYELTGRIQFAICEVIETGTMKSARSKCSYLLFSISLCPLFPSFSYAGHLPTRTPTISSILFCVCIISDGRHYISCFLATKPKRVRSMERGWMTGDFSYVEMTSACSRTFLCFFSFICLTARLYTGAFGLTLQRYSKSKSAAPLISIGSDYIRRCCKYTSRVFWFFIEFFKRPRAEAPIE